MKFSLRDLFLVTVIVALAVGWWVDHQAQVAMVKQLKLTDARRYELIATYKESNGKPVAVFRNQKDELPNSSAPVPNPPKP